MSTRIVVGTVEGDFGTATVLEQIGVPTERLNWGRLDPFEYSAIIVDRSLSSYEGKQLVEYLEGGGAILDLGYFAESRRLTSVRRRFRAVRGDADEPFRDVWLLDVDDTLRVAPEATRLGGLASIESHGRGCLVRLPIKLGRIARGHAFLRRGFFAPTGPFPDEVVARNPIGEVRKAVEGALIAMHGRRGLPFVQRWRFPGDNASLFCFRIDTDYATAADLEALRRVCDEHAVPGTWFLHVSAHESELEQFAHFDRHELAVHGYRHRAFDDFESSWGNIQEAVTVVRSAAIRPVGFAAPTGRWSRGLDRALAELGLLYSSEFTLDYDGLPFRPWNGSGPSAMLQVPVHPISADSIRRQGGDDDAVNSYFAFVLNRKLAQSEPAIFYHHPGYQSTGPIARLFERIAAAGIPAMTMRDFAEWWLARERSWVTASATEGAVRVSASVERPDVLVRIVRADGAERYVDSDGEFALAEGSWSHRTRALDHAFDPRPARRRTLRSVRHSIEDIYSRSRQ